MRKVTGSVKQRAEAAPSMGPQHESCGKEREGQREVDAAGPSMGPQHESCGKIEARYDSFFADILQWGRNMRVAESAFIRDPPLRRVTFNGAAT